MDDTKTLINTKLVPPKYSRFTLHRTQIIDQLEKGSQRTLSIINAPSGFGKTTILAQWRKVLLARGKSVAWLTLEKSDDNPDFFINYLIASLQFSGCDVGEGAMSIYSRMRTNAHDGFVTALVNELQLCKQDIYLLIDETHLLSNKTVIATLKSILMYAPDNFHIALATRKVPELPITYLNLHDEITSIEATQLRFTFEDTRQFLSSHLESKPLSMDHIRRLNEITEGWVTGLQIAIMALRNNNNPTQFIDNFSGNSSNVIQYLTNDVIPSLPASVVSFLVNISLLDRFNTDLCRALTSETDSRNSLEKLSAELFFIVPIENIPGWYRFHPLFSEYLQKRFMEYPIDKQKELHHRAATWLQKNDYFENAVKHLLEGGEVENAVKILEICALNFLYDGRFSTFLALIKKLPEAALNTSWQLQYVLLTSLTTTGQNERAAKLINTLQATTVDRKKLCFLKLVEAENAAYYDDSNETLRLMNEWMQASDGDHSVAFEVALAANIFTYAYAYAGKLEEAREIQLMTAKWSVSDIPLSTRVFSRCLVSLSHLMQGDISRALSQLEQLLSEIDEFRGRRSLLACMTAGLFVEALYESNQIERVLATLANRLDVIEETCYTDSMIRAHISYARTLATKGDINGAFDSLDRMRRKGESRGLVRITAYSLVERIRLALSRNDIQSAEALLTRLKECTQPFSDIRHGSYGAITQITLLTELRISVATYPNTQTISHLEAILQSAINCQHNYFAQQVRLLLAIALNKLGDKQQAQEHLANALDIGLRYSMLRIFIDEGSDLKLLIQKYLAVNDSDLDPEMRNYIGKLLTTYLTPQRQQVNADADADADEIFEFLKDLTEREREVLKLLTQGMPNKKIASILNLSVETVKWHLKNIYGKLGVTSRSQAADLVRSHGIQ